jgi:serine/threonine-protein kinase
MSKNIKDEDVSQVLQQCAKMFGSSKKNAGQESAALSPLPNPMAHTTPPQVSTQAETGSVSRQPLATTKKDMLGRYRLLQQIGEGGMGKVYKAFDPMLERVVALKLLNGVAMEEPVLQQRFVREARSIARLSHPHIVTVHDFQESGGAYFLIMQFIDGCSLEKKMHQEWLSLPEVCRLMLDMLDAVGYACNKGVIHRDLKPSNILLDRQGNLFISDFGLAKILDSDIAPISRAGQILGTPTYMSPEQALQSPENPVDAQSDIYSLGVIMFEMLTGRPPFHSDKVYQILYKLSHEDVPDPRSIRAELPNAIAGICLKALQRDKTKRYREAAEMAGDVQRYIAQRQDTPLRTSRRATIATPEITMKMSPAVAVSNKPKSLTATAKPMAAASPKIGRPVLLYASLTAILAMFFVGAFFGYKAVNQYLAKGAGNQRSAPLPLDAPTPSASPAPLITERKEPWRPPPVNPDTQGPPMHGRKKAGENWDKEWPQGHAIPRWLKEKFDADHDGKLSQEEKRRMQQWLATTPKRRPPGSDGGKDGK